MKQTTWKVSGGHQLLYMENPPAPLAPRPAKLGGRFWARSLNLTPDKSKRLNSRGDTSSDRKTVIHVYDEPLNRSDHVKFAIRPSLSKIEITITIPKAKVYWFQIWGASGTDLKLWSVILIVICPNPKWSSTMTRDTCEGLNGIYLCITS